MVMAESQNPHQEPAEHGVELVHRVAQSPLGELWLALDQRRGPPGEPMLVRYVSLSGGATEDTLERVAAAARAAMNLRHELLLPVLEVQQYPLAVAYAYVEAQPLSTLLSSARARELLFPVGVSLRLIIDLLRALQAVHESWLGWPTEVPYGGLLPGSVLVSRDGRTRLCDALVASSALLQRGFDLSSAELAYRAPEQVYASIAPEPSTDVFIAAVLLWELVSGRRLLSGPKDVIERKLLEHDLPAATAALRSDCQLSRGLLELLDSSLAPGPHQRPSTPGALATALERCGHVVATHAEVAAFVNELAGPQLDRVAATVRFAEPSGSRSAAPDAPKPAVAPLAPPALGTRAGAVLPSGVTPRSVAASVAQALERHRASGEFAAFAPAPERVAPAASSLESLAVALPLVRSAPPPLPPPLPRPRPAQPSFSDDEKTSVLRAVSGQSAGRVPAKSSAPVRLAPKRALLAAMAGVALLIQLWMLSLVRSHQEPSRSVSTVTASAKPKASPSPHPSFAGAAHERRDTHRIEHDTDAPIVDRH